MLTLLVMEEAGLKMAGARFINMPINTCRRYNLWQFQNTPSHVYLCGQAPKNKWYVTVDYKRDRLKLKIDTGATCNVMLRRIYDI